MKTFKLLFTCILFCLSIHQSLGASITIHIVNANYNQNQFIIAITCYNTNSNNVSFTRHFNLENHDSTSTYFSAKTYSSNGLGLTTYYDTLTFYHPTYMHDLKIVDGEWCKINQSWLLNHGIIDFQTSLRLPYNHYNTVPNGYYIDSLTNNWFYGGMYGGVYRLGIHDYHPSNLDTSILSADYIGVEVDFIRIQPNGNSPIAYIGVNYEYPDGILTPYNYESYYSYQIPEDSLFHITQLIPTDSFGNLHLGGGTYYDNLTFYPVYNKYICPSEGIEINGTYISNEGLYIDSLLTTLGTDSIVGINLMYKTIVYGDTLEAEICEGDFYIFHDTLNIYNPGVYTFITENSGGCDSIFYLNLQIQNNMISNSIYNNNGILTYDDPQAGYSYQWYNALTNMPITGENNPTYNPSVNGTYVLEISDGICSRSTNTITTTFGLLQWEKNMSITPNPFSESFLLDFTTVLKEVDISLLDVQSKIVYQNTYYNTQTVKMNNTALAEGIYYLSIKTKNQQITRKMICIR